MHNLEQKVERAAISGQSDSWVKRHALIKDGIKDHNKIFLFSSSAGQKYWIIVTSENLTDTARQKHQAGIIIRDKKLFKKIEKYWFDIKDGTFNGKRNIFKESDIVTVMLFPQHSGADSIYTLLENMSTDPEHAKQGKIKISMPRWSYERTPLAFKLVHLADKGYNVEIITRDNYRIVDDQILRTLENKPNVKLMAVDVADLNIHSKYILFDGFYGREEKIPQKIVWTGSHNFTGMALRENYEAIVQIKIDNIYEAYNQNFEKLKVIIRGL